MLKNIEQRVLIIDFGSQVTQLIGRRVREAQIYCEIVPYQLADAWLAKQRPAAIILSGSPYSTLSADHPTAPAVIWELGVPILGICYGEQLICRELGGEVEGGHNGEFGRAIVDVIADSALFSGCWQVGQSYEVWMSHGDRVVSLPLGFKAIASSEGAPFAAIANEEKQIYGVQFHIEVVHTKDGKQLIENFLFNIARLVPNWNMRLYKDQAVQELRAKLGDAKVICGLSGGVDSSVTAALLNEAIGENLTCILVDHGLMRQNEAAEVGKMFADEVPLKLKIIDAKDKFLTALAGVTDPEAKRKIIGRLFIEEFEAAAKTIGGVEFLAQGTLYPDVIESVSNVGDNSLTIKSHHNVGGLPEKMNLGLVEPLRNLFKDEVRLLGKELGLPSWFIDRHPFPGPGLAIRCPGEVTEEKLNILRAADEIYISELKKRGLYQVIWQAFAVLLPVRTVGVMGDGRSYDYVCALRAVTSVDGMTADFYQFDMNILGEIATKIINEVKGINRIVYDVTSKPPGTIEWE